MRPCTLAMLHSLPLTPKNLMALQSHVRLVKPETDAALVDYLANRRLFGVLPRDALVRLAG